MVNENYAKAYKEVLKILENVRTQDVSKIPKEMIEMFKENQDNYYEFKIDMNKSFDEQKLMKETKAILANIFRDYWATEYQKEKILQKERYDIKKEERELRNKCNPDNLFKNKGIKANDEKPKNKFPIKVENQKFYTKLIAIMKKVFKC
ncbi:MAG: hypothetical protein ACLTBX_01105 [Clostridia bacterium]|nr:hypothetical protein [Clostridium sp.]